MGPRLQPAGFAYIEPHDEDAIGTGVHGCRKRSKSVPTVSLYLTSYDVLARVRVL